MILLRVTMDTADYCARSRRLPLAVVGAVVCTALVLPLPAQQTGDRDPRHVQPGGAQEDTVFSDEIRVQLFRVPVRALDHEGAPLPNLDADDFRVEVGGHDVPVVAVDWITPAEAAEATTDTEIGTATPDSPAQPVRLVVLYVQWSQLPHRNLGLQKMLVHIPQILDGLRPTDRVAVFSFEHRLKLVSDFTSDRAMILDALERAVFARPPETLPASDSPSIAAVLDTDRARRAAFVEDGLSVVADALAHFPGEKIMLFVGWGLGAEHGGRPTPRYREAARKLRRARVTVSSLAASGLTPLVPSNLTKTVSYIAYDTGGSFDSLVAFPHLAARRLRHIFDGYYEVFFRVPSIRYTGRVRVTLREGPFRVHHAEYAVTPEPTS